MDLDLNLLKLKSGAFVKEENRIFFLTKEDKPKNLKFFLKDILVNKNIRLLQLKARNIGNKEININSLMVGEFLLPNFIPDQILENSWLSTGFSRYRKKITPTRKRFFLTRNQNPYSFLKEYGYLENSLISEWYTQLIKDGQSFMIGAVTATDQFSQIFVRKEEKGIKIRITCQLDGTNLNPGSEIDSEKIVFITGGKKESLEIFARLIKKESKIETSPKPIKALCCAWYYQGAKVNEKYIIDQLKVTEEFPKNARPDYIQIDDGYCAWGDWLDTKKQFPSGMKFIVEEIRKRGLKAGIWIAPFVAGPRSRIFKERPDWFLKNSKGNYFQARLTSPFDWLPFLSSYALDPTHPEVQNHLENIIKEFISFGFKMFKVDFTYPVCFTNKYHLSVTRPQALRIGLEIIRKTTGKKVHLLSAISPLSPFVGLVDSARVGMDTSDPHIYPIPILNRIINCYMLKENLRNCKVRQFLNGKIWINDADCLVCRLETGLTKNLMKKHLEFILNYGGSRWLGDNLTKLGEWQREIIHKLLS